VAVAGFPPEDRNIGICTNEPSTKEEVLGQDIQAGRVRATAKQTSDVAEHAKRVIPIENMRMV